MATLKRALQLTIPRVLNSTAIPTRAAVVESFRPIPNLFSRFYSSNESISSQGIDLSNEESKRQLVNRLVYGSKQRGYLELNLILGGWVEDHIRSLDENGIKSLVDVLNLEDPDLWTWLTGQEQPPEKISKNPIFVAVHNKVMDNLDNHASPETRAVPGKPWVRGWDDFKKGRDSPIVGNQ